MPKTIFRIINAKGQTLAKDGKFYGSYTPTKSGGTVEFSEEPKNVPAGCNVQKVGVE